MTITRDELRRIPLLTELDDKELSRLAKDISERTFPAGKALVEQGQSGIGFFMILDGQVSVRFGDEVRATLGPGSYVGEMALLKPDSVRSASVVAESEVRCAIMPAWQFRPFVKQHPTVAWRLLEVLAGRLQEAELRASSRGEVESPA